MMGLVSDVGRRLKATLALVALAIGVMVTPAAAQDDVDAHLWTQVVATLRPAEEWRLHLEVQPRWFQNVTEPFQILGRAAVGRRLGNRVTVWGGYAYVAKPPGPGITHEHRTWQQLSMVLPSAGKWNPSMRLRLEQRHQANWGDQSHRLRMMGRVNRPIRDDRRWSLGLWNETFATLDETLPGPRRGFDQNRAAFVLTRQVAKQVAVDVGYMWVAQRALTNRRAHAHVALVVVNVTP